MAPKREKTLLENPPAASTSEEEEIEEDEEEEEEIEEVIEEEEEDDEEEEEDDEDEATTGKPDSSSAAVKKPKSDSTPSSGSKSPQTPSSNEEEEEEEESEESDSEPTPPKLKPLGTSTSSNPSAGKPTVSQPKKTTVTKPSITTTPTKPSATTVKRPLESENDSKRKKKKVDNEDSNLEESEKRTTFGPKSVFQRLWSDEDEIVLLKGMIELKKKGDDPFSDLGEFLDSIKKSLHVEVKTDQLSNKIKRLKKKYLNNYKRGKGDEDPVFSKPHDVISYELMKEVWGGTEGNIRENNNGGTVVAAANGKNSKTKSNSAMKTLSLSDISMRESLRVDESGSLHPCVQQMQMQMQMVPSRDNMVGESFLKEGSSLIGESKSKELQKKWRSLYAAELQLYLRRVELVREQTIAILDAHKSSDNE